MAQDRHEIRNSMQITWDQAVAMDDGIALRCDVFRPVAEGRYPVIMAMGAYGKLLRLGPGPQPRRLGAHDRRPSRGAGELVEPVPEVGK